MAEIYHKLKNFRLVQRAWLSSFKNGRVPTPGTIKNTLDRFYKTGSVASLPLLWVQPIKKREDTKNQQKGVFLKNPSLSVRKASAYTGISYDMVQSILREDLHMKLYKFHEWHQAMAADFQKCVKFSDFFMGLPNKARSLLIWCNEAHFYLMR